MRSWQHNIERVMLYRGDDDGTFLIYGDTFEHKSSYKPIKWSFLINGSGELVKEIEPNNRFYQYSILDKCISELIRKYRLKFVSSDETEFIAVYQIKENGEFFRELCEF